MERWIASLVGVADSAVAGSICYNSAKCDSAVCVQPIPTGRGVNELGPLHSAFIYSTIQDLDIYRQFPAVWL